MFIPDSDLPDPGSEFFHPGSRNPGRKDSRSASKIGSKLSDLDSDLDFYPSGSRGQKGKDPGSGTMTGTDTGTS
jgi:hypothetical protein